MNADCLNDRISLLQSNLKHMASFGAIKPRMQAQQTVLFNLINLEMARDSKELIVATKRDSSAMKIIAMLTTIFLPGTFVATFFAMPLFDWSKLDMKYVMTDHFWVYWAIAIPLTILVMTVVGLYGFSRARKHRRDAENARRNIGFRMFNP